MIEYEEKMVGLGDMITILSGSMAIVSKIAKGEHVLTKDTVEDAKVITDLFKESFSEELLEQKQKNLKQTTEGAAECKSLWRTHIN